VDAETGAHIVQPNKRLSQSRLEKLESIGFAWVAKNVRKPKPTVGGATTKPKKAPDDSKSASRNRLADIQWQEMYQRLTVYKEEQGVSEESKRAYFFSIKGDSRFTC
jgi:predicted oxidoreductase